MKKNFLRILIVVVIIFASIQIVHAYSNGGQTFGGRIINTKAIEVEALESSGWTCIVPGTSITITPIKGPATYLIPFNITSKTNRMVTFDKWIMGRYAGTTTVTCERPCGPTVCLYSLELNTINFFGNS